MSEQALTAADFTDFFQPLWGKTPFPWQYALVERVLAEGPDPWPETIALPTAAGKTACLWTSPSSPWQPRRIGRP
jgi:CRISPR-associated endonuclease/helicase Cas3